MDPGPYFSYAWQWLAFGTMSILAIGFFIVREFRDPRDPDSAGLDPVDDLPDADRPDRDLPAGDGPAERRPNRELPDRADAAKRRSRKGFDRSSLYDQS